MSRDEAPITIAANRLLEKQTNVRDQLRAVTGCLEGLGRLEGELDGAVEEAAARVDSVFASLASAVERRKSEVLRSLREALAERREALDEHRKKYQEAIVSANKVRTRAQVTYLTSGWGSPHPRSMLSRCELPSVLG